MNRRRISEAAEAELKVMTQNVYNHFGVMGVMETIMEMRETEIIILKKLNEIIVDENKRRGL